MAGARPVVTHPSLALLAPRGGPGWPFDPTPEDRIALRTDSKARARGLLSFAVALGPSLAAIWLVPGFVTQDGPAHVYNAHILVESLRGDSPFRDYFEVRWGPLPNWAGHLASMGLVAMLSAQLVERVMMSLTLVGLAASSGWLRWRVAGWEGMPTAALAATMLAINVTWLFGFWSFLLGSCLFALTLGVWWDGRERMGAGRAVVIAALLAAGYFCHLVSLGLTAVGLLVLAIISRRGNALVWTGASLGVLVPLGLIYRGMMRTGGALRPAWGELADPTSIRSWWRQLGWVDPITLGSKRIAPFVEAKSPWFGMLVPTLWFGLGLAVFVVATLRRGSMVRRRRGWLVLAGVLLVGGMIGPDRLGPSHGDYLPQRVMLLGLLALLPAIDFIASGFARRVGGTCLVAAVVLQSAFVWDYGLRSSRLVGEFLRTEPHVGRGQRVGALLIDLRGPYRANPLLHIDQRLGVGTGNVIWTNYEAAHYYFPVRFRSDRPHPPELEFEAISKLDDPADAPERRRRWEALLAEHHPRIDRLVIWGTDPTLEAIAGRWFEPIVGEGKARVWRRLPAR